MVKLILLLAVMTLLLACSASSSYIKEPDRLLPDHQPLADIELNIANLGPCTDSPQRAFRINSNYPVTIFVHGHNSSPQDFFILAQLYQFYGMQTVCFSYPYRDSLLLTAEKLAFSLEQLLAVTENKEITVFGHSLGGLVARKALEKSRFNRLSDKKIKIGLITVAAPFAGVSAADVCASELLNWLSFGIISGICWGVTGDNWYEITSASDFIKYPKPLLPCVYRYLKVVTNEKNSCRHKNKQGVCVESDYVFELSEQYNPAVDNYSLVKNIQIDAGHVEIIGSKQQLPFKLLAILRQEAMLSAVPWRG
jgi:hypothetical protein